MNARVLERQKFVAARFGRLIIATVRTSSAAMAERPCELGDFRGGGGSL